MVFWKNVLSYIFDYVVQVDVSKVAYRSVVELGMEILVANKFVQFVIGYSGGDYGMVFLKVLLFVVLCLLFVIPTKEGSDYIIW